MSTSVRRRLWIGMLGAAAGLAALSGAARAQSTDNDGCSNATLQGDYAFTIHIESTGIVTSAGQVHFPTVTSDGVSMTKFDGKGGLTQVDFVMRGGVPREPSVPDPTTGFFVDQSGTYTVFPDCTGNFEIDFHTSGQVIKEMFVLASQGREIRAVVNEQQVTDGTFVGGGLRMFSAIFRPPATY